MRRTERVARVTGGSGLGFYWDTESLQSSTDCLGAGCMPLKSKPKKKINPIVITDFDRKGLNLGTCTFVCVCLNPQLSTEKRRLLTPDSVRPQAQQAAGNRGGRRGIKTNIRVKTILRLVGMLC